MKSTEKFFVVLGCFLAQATNSGMAAARLEGNLTCSVETRAGGFRVPLGYSDTCTYSPTISATEVRATDARLVYGVDDGHEARIEARSFAGVQANYGSLQIYATSEIRMLTYGPAEAKAQASAAFSDSILVTSASLPRGSIVLVKLNYTLDFSNASNLISTNSSAIGRFSYDLSGFYSIGPGLAASALNNGWNSTQGEIHYSGSTFIGSHYSTQKIIEVRVGDIFDVDASLYGIVSSSGNLPYESRGSYLGYADTEAHFFLGKGVNIYLTPLGADVALVSDSGHHYGLSSAVPESSVWQSLTLGLIFLLLTVRNKIGSGSITDQPQSEA